MMAVIMVEATTMGVEATTVEVETMVEEEEVGTDQYNDRIFILS